MADISYWSWLSTIYLIYATVRELRGKEDDQNSIFFLWGLTISLNSHIHRSISYLLLLIAIMFIGIFLVNYYKFSWLNNTVWIVYGLSLISAYYPLIYVLSSILIIPLVFLIAKIITKANFKDLYMTAPKNTIQLAIFSIICLIMGLY